MFKNYFYNHSFKANRLTYQKETLETVGDALGQTASAIASVFETVAGLATKTIDYLEVGGVKLKDSLGKLIDEYGNPDEPDFAADIYKKDYVDIWPVLLPEDMNPDLRYAINAQARIYYIKYKLNEMLEFNRQANEYLKKAERERERVEKDIFKIKKSKIIAQSQYDQISEQITMKEENLKNFPRTSIRYGEIEDEIKGLKQKQALLDERTSEVVEWDKPSIVSIEFPHDSGQFMERLVFDPKVKVKVNVNELCTFIQTHIDDSLMANVDTEEYEDELNKLAFHRDKYHNKLEWQAAYRFKNFDNDLRNIFDSALALAQSRMKLSTLKAKKEDPKLLDIRTNVGNKSGTPIRDYQNMSDQLKKLK